jgi:hypothetical protein
VVILEIEVKEKQEVQVERSKSRKERPNVDVRWWKVALQAAVAATIVAAR